MQRKRNEESILIFHRFHRSSQMIVLQLVILMKEEALFITVSLADLADYADDNVINFYNTQEKIHNL